MKQKILTINCKIVIKFKGYQSSHQDVANNCENCTTDGTFSKVDWHLSRSIEGGSSNYLNISSFRTVDLHPMLKKL